jgi:hypothetical protein
VGIGADGMPFRAYHPGEFLETGTSQRLRRPDRVRRRHVRLRQVKWDLDSHTSSRSLTHLAGNPGNKPAARDDHTAQPGPEPALNRFPLKPLALAHAEQGRGRLPEDGCPAGCQLVVQLPDLGLTAGEVGVPVRDVSQTCVWMPVGTRKLPASPEVVIWVPLLACHRCATVPEFAHVNRMVA